LFFIGLYFLVMILKTLSDTMRFEVAREILLNAEKEINGLGLTIHWGKDNSVSLFDVQSKIKSEWEEIMKPGKTPNVL